MGNHNTRHHSAEQGREAPGECLVTPLGLGHVTRVYPQSIFRSRKLRLAGKRDSYGE